MSAYVYTPELHKQALDALTELHNNCLDFFSKGNYDMVMADEAIKKLQALQPQEPVAIVAKDGFAQISMSWRRVVEHNTELYTLGGMP